MYDLKEKDALADQVEQGFNATKRKQQMKIYDNKLEELANTIEDMAERHGQDYFMIEILTMFLDVSIKMKEVMEMMSSMNMVMELFGEAVNFIDESMALQSNIMESSTTVKYGLFSRITNHFKTKRIIRNNVNRIKTISSNILAKYKMASGMVNSLKGVSETLKKTTAKMSGKKSSGASTENQYSSAMSYLNERRARKGMEPVATAPQSAPSASAPQSSSGGLDLSGL